MGIFDLAGVWSLDLEDGTHQVKAEIKSGLLAAHLTVTWDGQVLCHVPIFVIIGEMRRFQQNGHSFVLGHRGYGMLGQFVLSMDGRDLGASPAEAAVAGPTHVAALAREYVKGIRSLAEPTASPAPSPAPQQSPVACVQFVKELNCTEIDEVVGREDYPLDNRFGSSPFSTDRQVCKETTNELTVDVTTGLSGKLNFDPKMMSALKLELAAQFTKQTGQKVGEKVTESQTLHFTVAAHQAVLYQVVWKRKVRSGEQLYMADGAPLTVPYRVNYGLSCEVRTLELPKTV